MRFDEIVIRKMQDNRGLEVFELFAERQCETRQPLAMRSHGQIRALDVGRAEFRGTRNAVHD